MKKLQLIGGHIFIGLRLILEALGYGVDWEYYHKEMKIFNEWVDDYDRSVNLLCRKSTISGKLQYRTMRSSCNGIDDNQWIDYDGEDLELRIYK